MSEPPIIQQAEHPGTIVASALAGQLGSDLNYISRGKVQMSRFSVVTEREKPLLLYARIRGQKSRTWRLMREEILDLNVSLGGGRGRRDIIKMEQVSHGVPVETSSELEALKPGWLGRNLTQRNWQETALDEGKI